MPRLEWDKVGEHFYETGVDRGVCYPQADDGKYPKGAAWNGLTSVAENPSGADATNQYANNAKYLTLRSAESLGLTIQAYTYPDEFKECDGSAELAAGISIGQQARKAFGFSYRTLVGNDVKLNDYGYKIHCVYGCSVSPSEKSFSTVNDSPEPVSMSWTAETTPVQVKDHKPTASVTVDCSKLTETQVKALEDALYGTEAKDGYLPLPEEIATIIAAA